MEIYYGKLLLLDIDTDSLELYNFVCGKNTSFVDWAFDYIKEHQLDMSDINFKIYIEGKDQTELFNYEQPIKENYRDPLNH